MAGTDSAHQAEPSGPAASGRLLPPLPAPRWELILYLALIAMAAALRFWDLDARVLHHDESLHAGLAWQLADGRGYTHVPFMHGPFQFIGAALVFLLSGDSDYTARVLPALFGTALVALPFFLRGHLGRTGALVAALLLAISPTLLYYGRFAREDIYAAFWTLALVICLWRYLARPRALYLHLTAAILALSFATKEITFIVVAILLFYLDLLVAQDLATQASAPASSDGGSDRTHYQTLGLPEGATIKAIRRAHRRLIERPEGPCPAELARLDEAYRTLSNPRRRQAYDRELARRREAPAPPGHDELADVAPAPAARQSALAFAALLPTAWLIAALWPLLGPLRRRFRLRTLPPAGHLLVLVGCLSLPQFAAALQKLPFVGDRGYAVPEEDALMRATVMGLILLSFAVGLLWRWRVWIIAFALFYTVFILLYTTLFTNPEGFWTGIWGSLDYWLGQQRVHRGDQPSYYYFMLLPLYEFLPLAFALGGALFCLFRARAREKAIALAGLGLVLLLALAGDALPVPGPYLTAAGFLVVIGLVLVLPMGAVTRFLACWTLAALFALTLAGEKMPWLNVHLALPLALLAAKLLNDLLTGVEVRVPLAPVRRWAPFAGAALAAALTVVLLLIAGSSPVAAIAGWALGLAALAAVAWSGHALGPRVAVQVGAVALVAAFGALTLRTGLLASWGHDSLPQARGLSFGPDHGGAPVEMLVYVQSTPDILRVRDEIDRLASSSGKAHELPIVIDSTDGFSWPWAWYLRRYTELTFTEISDGFSPEPGSVVLLNKANASSFRPDPALFATAIPYRHRWWFPESYRGFTSAALLGELFDPSAWKAWRTYFVDRTPPGDPGSSDAIAYLPRSPASGATSEVLFETSRATP